jgi:hypothetical protein
MSTDISEFPITLCDFIDNGIKTVHIFQSPDFEMPSLSGFHVSCSIHSGKYSIKDPTFPSRKADRTFNCCSHRASVLVSTISSKYRSRKRNTQFRVVVKSTIFVDYSLVCFRAPGLFSSAFCESFSLEIQRRCGISLVNKKRCRRHFGC